MQVSAMRLGNQDPGWILTPDGALYGLSLGADYCAEHEQGIDPLKKAMGFNPGAVPVGIEERLIRIVPDQLVSGTVMVKPQDKRRKAYPAEVLFVSAHSFPGITSPTEAFAYAKSTIGFYQDPGSPTHTPRFDVMCAWDKREFAVLVRGTDNIARLREIVEAWREGKLVLSPPAAEGFHRCGPTFVLDAAISPEQREQVRENDLAHQRLTQATKDSGIEALLAENGKRWFALKPDWYSRDNEEGLMFFLNPCEQQLYNFGWFSLEELQLWAQGTGPVLLDKELNDLVRKNELGIEVLRRANNAGIGLRRGARFKWADEQKTQVMVDLLLTPGSAGIVQRECLLEDFRARYPLPEATTTP